VIHPSFFTKNMNPIISVRDLRKTYVMGADTIHALKSVSLDISKNEYVALMGPSGSGKSTLMNLLGCLDTPTSGSYMLNGIDVSSMNDSELAEVRNKEIGFVFQTFNLLPRMSSLENVALPLVYSGIKNALRVEKAEKAMKAVGLGDRMSHKPNELSGGQRQRVAVARALVNDPAIILADEPTGNLDTKTSIEIMGLFEQIHKAGNTVILVTHEPDIAQHAHRIIRLRDGLVESDIQNEHILSAFDPNHPFLAVKELF
jgi:putative ABC transport system ATP-binding protein